MALNPVEFMGASGYLPLPAEVILEERTGQSAPVELLAMEGPLAVFQHRPTCTKVALQSSLMTALGGSEPTSYGTSFIIDASALLAWISSSESTGFSTLVVKPAAKPIRRLLSEAVPAIKATSSGHQKMVEAITPAEELRALTRLPPGMLGDLFGVSRTTFYKWIDGATPRDERFQHLVEALTHLKDARQRLPQTIDFTAWLRTPISPGAKTPLDYLRDRRFSLFRGLILRSTSTSMGFVPVTSAIPSQPMSRAERMVARERISPSPRLPSDDED